MEHIVSESVDHEQLQFIECPAVQSVVGHVFSPVRLAKLTGTLIRITRIEVTNNASKAIIKTSHIIEALADNPERFYWKGYYDAQQPKSYGLMQTEPVDPELTFELCDVDIAAT